MKVNMKRFLAILCGIIMVCNGGMVAFAQENMEELIIGEYQELAGDNVTTLFFYLIFSNPSLTFNISSNKIFPLIR